MTLRQLTLADARDIAWACGTDAGERSRAHCGVASDVHEKGENRCT